MGAQPKETTSGFRLVHAVTWLAVCCLAFSSGRVVRTKYGTLKGVTLQGSLHRSGQYCTNSSKSFDYRFKEFCSPSSFPSSSSSSSRILQDTTGLQQEQQQSRMAGRSQGILRASLKSRQIPHKNRRASQSPPPPVPPSPAPPSIPENRQESEQLVTDQTVTLTALSIAAMQIRRNTSDQSQNINHHQIPVHQFQTSETVFCFLKS